MTDLLEAKEEVLEQRLWSAETALRELATLLDDLRRARGEPDDASAAVAAYRQRAAQGAHAVALEEIIRADRPIDLSPVEPGTRGPEDGEPGPR